MRRVYTGFHVIEEMLKKKPSFARLLVSKSGKRREDLINEAKRQAIDVLSVSSEKLDELSGAADHRGMVLELEEKKERPISFKDILSGDDSEEALVLILDGITDPQNLGAVLRSSDLFELDLVILPKRRSAKEGQTVAKTSAGASSYVSVDYVPNLNRAILDLKQAGFWIYGADARGENVSELSFGKRLCLVMGSEGKGLSRLVRENCDKMVRIPSGGHIDSFNVSVACGILLHEVRRIQKYFS